ncbi:MAG: hypothetical protein H6742_19295 [Alphaproteobacteria bacterium]|nr:hypothetical protein [Alphaproteobacteria bacterium]
MAETRRTIRRADAHRLARGLPPEDRRLESALVRLSRNRPEARLPQQVRPYGQLAVVLALTLPTLMFGLVLILTPLTLLQLALGGGGALLLEQAPEQLWGGLGAVVGLPWLLFLLTGFGMLRSTLSIAQGTAVWRREVAAALAGRAWSLTTGRERIDNLEVPRDGLEALRVRTRSLAADWAELCEEGQARQALAGEIRAAPIPGALPDAPGADRALVRGRERARLLATRVEAAAAALAGEESLAGEEAPGGEGPGGEGPGLLPLELYRDETEELEDEAGRVRRQLGLVVRRQPSGTARGG